MTNPFDKNLVNEWSNSLGLSDSTKRTYTAAVKRYGKCWNECGHQTASAWGLYADTRKESKSPRPAHIYIREGKRCVDNYLTWLRLKHEDVWQLYDGVTETPISESRIKIPDGLDFEDLLVWLNDQAHAIHAQRGMAVEDIIRFACAPDTPEFRGAVKCVKDYDVTIKRFEDLITLVEMFKEI